MAKIPPGILAWITLVLVESTVAKAMPEYAAAESKETARVTGNILGSPAEPGIADVTALVEFTGNGATNKGSRPNGLIFASDGDIYGTTEYGGANDYGTVFKMTPAGALSTIVEFAGNAPVNSSGFPMAPLTERRDGDFYGTTSGGGVGPTGENNLDNGTIFKLSRSGVLTTLVRFSCNGTTNKGCTPYSRLIEAPNGDFYGTTFSGGSAKAVPIPGFRGFGTIYKMMPAGQLTTLYDFSAHLAKGQGGSPWAGMTLGRDGNLYGTTWGGLGVAGTIFKFAPRAAMTTLVRFGIKPPNKKGGGCTVELLQAGDGNFYGTCPIGGDGNGGTVFKMTPSGAFTNLVEFSTNDPKGAQPYAALAEGNDGNLYGTTTVGGAYNYGTIFRVTPSGSFKVLWNFNNPNKIHECQHPGTGPLLKDKEGDFYGTTKWGGRSDWGTVFKLTLHNSDMQASTAPPVDSPSRATSQPAQMEQAQSSAAPHDFKTAKQKLIAQDAAYHEYSAAEAYKHIGETARLTGMVDCIGNGRRHTDVQIGGCLPECVLWVVVPNDAKGPELDSWKLLGLNIAVTGKIESSEGTPQITINSTKQIEAQPSTDSNYLATAHEKENKSDFNGAIADLDRAIEQTHAPGAYTEQARLKANKGDFAGAIRDYDELITRSADTYALARGAQYNSRAQLKIKGADFDGAIADADVAIRLNPRAPWHYSTRGQANEGKGDFASAIKDYEMAIQTQPHNSAYKDMLRHAQAAVDRNHEQSSNKNEGSPESIAEAFVQAYSGADVDAVARLYGDRVDYTNSGVISNAGITRQAQEYFTRWPARQWRLAGPVKTTSMGPSRQKVIFSASYDASNPQTNKHASGIARETLIVASDASGAMKIVSQKEQTSKRSSSQPGKETSQGLGPNAVDDQHANGGTLDEFMGDVTGTVVYADEKRGYIEIDREKHDGRGNFEVVLTGDLHTPKVGEKVSVHWYSCGGGSIHVSNRDRPHCADKIEKVGNAEAGLNRENSAATQQEFDPGSYFRLTTKWQGDAKSLDIVNDGKNNNRPILANTGNFSGQYWKIAPVGDGYYRLTTKWQGTAKSLDVVSDGKNNNQLILAKTGNYSGQYWKITPVGDGYYRLTTQWQGAGKSLDIVNDGTNNNQPILAHTGNYSGQFWRLTAAAFSLAQAERPEKLKSPDGKYSIEVVRGTEDSLVLSHGGEVISKVPTSVGPVGSFFEALWHPDGSYVAVNKQRSSRSGGDSMWILALPTGKVLRKPDDAFCDELEKRASAYIDEKHLSETKVSLTLIATGWGKGRLRFRLEAWFGEMEFSYFFDGTVEPLNLRTINDWKVSTTKS